MVDLTPWDDRQPINRQLRERIVAMMLEGLLTDRDSLPSVRTLAAELGINALTVLKSYQQLVDEQIVQKRRGRGMFVDADAVQVLRIPAMARPSRHGGEAH